MKLFLSLLSLVLVTSVLAASQLKDEKEESTARRSRSERGLYLQRHNHRNWEWSSGLSKNDGGKGKGKVQSKSGGSNSGGWKKDVTPPSATPPSPTPPSATPPSATPPSACECCSIDMYEFLGNTEALTPLVGEENSLGTTYKLDDQLYKRSGGGNLDDPIEGPAVLVTATCTQIRPGTSTSICILGLTMCDFVFEMSDSLGTIGQFVASGNLLDNTVNVIPITGGTDALKGATGEVLITAVYDNPKEETCPNISEVFYYEVTSKVEVEFCEYGIENLYSPEKTKNGRKKKEEKKL